MRVKSCKHLQHAWFNPSLESPDPSPRQPQDILRELLTNTMISGNPSVDRLFINELLDKADNFRSLPPSASPRSFSKFRKLPPEIRQAIWLFSIPQRTIHISEVLTEAVCWNRRLPIPTPALACREAWGVIRPRMHAIFNEAGERWLEHDDEDVKMKRTAWITSSDRLSMGLYDFHLYGVAIKRDDAPSAFGSIAISLEQLEPNLSFARFDKHFSLSIHPAQKIRVVVQTIVIEISDKPTRYGTIYPLTSRDLTASASFLGEDEALEWTFENMRFPPACDTPTHFVEVVDLQDRRRLNELTTLVMANGGSS
ncbi:hypothetical protein CcaCcLH18_07836 [Colletotrichum camelliae]|nr:hypothetical protein CcaCcLH18_07836 [Colletotrichum camelliae]